MSLLPIFVDYFKDNKGFRVPVVAFSNNLEEALILFDKNFVKVKVEEIKFAKWDL